jgi:hypothetical protein
MEVRRTDEGGEIASCRKFRQVRKEGDFATVQHTYWRQFTEDKKIDDIAELENNKETRQLGRFI